MEDHAIHCAYQHLETGQRLRPPPTVKVEESLRLAVPSTSLGADGCYWQPPRTATFPRGVGVPARGWVPDLSPNFGLQSGEVDGGDPTTRAAYLVWPGCTVLETPFCRASKGKNEKILPQKAGKSPISGDGGASALVSGSSARWARTQHVRRRRSCQLDAERCQSG